ncbi:MAG: CCA tRNA nucleotidyltransferase, partial [Methanobacteriota archaeon]
QGLSLARRIAGEYGESCREMYAEHPYINATVRGVDVDLVPAYEVACATEIKSAVDRTPFHTRYITERIRDLVDDVLLTKQFAKAGGVYGSDQMTEGFSGYLCELLVLHYGGFRPLLAAAADWRPRTVIDIERHGSRRFPEPLTVVDPVDPNRNVAAAVSLSRMFEFVELARGYRVRPSACFFEADEFYSLDRRTFAECLDRRGTALVALVFPTPPCIPEVLVPQLRKSHEAIRGLLERNGFLVNRSDSAMQTENCMLLFELLVDALPSVRRHVGPPLWSSENADKFMEKHGTDSFARPFIEDGLYIVEIPRRFTRAADLLADQEVLAMGLGRHVRQAMEQGWCVYEGRACWQDEFGSFLSGFLARASPLARVRKREKRAENRLRS